MKSNVMKKSIGILAALALCLFAALPITAQTYSAQSGVSLLTGVAATATAVSGQVRLPNFVGTGTLNITESGITGSPSGCTIALAYVQNNSTTATAAVASIAFTPSTGTQQIAVTPSVPSGDNYMATYACSSTYPTAGAITVSFSPSVSATLDPCLTSPKKSAAISVATAGQASLVALATGKSIYVCGLTDGSAGTTPSFTLESGTVAGCASGTTALSGAIPFTSGNTITLMSSGTIASVPSGGVLCALTVGNGHYGLLTYVQQ
jgi:hypothetical protein